jgi:hypothetical protein
MYSTYIILSRCDVRLSWRQSSLLEMDQCRLHVRVPYVDMQGGGRSTPFYKVRADEQAVSSVN